MGSLIGQAWDVFLANSVVSKSIGVHAYKLGLVGQYLSSFDEHLSAHRIHALLELLVNKQIEMWFFISLS